MVDEADVGRVREAEAAEAEAAGDGGGRRLLLLEEGAAWRLQVLCCLATNADCCTRWRAV